MNFIIPQNPKAILFDLGGVLLKLDLQKTFDAFAQLGFHNFEQHFDSYSGSPFIEDFEEGKLSNTAFLEEIRKRCDAHTNEQQILTAWNAMLGELPLAHFELLQRLRKKYSIFLYSNTNALHVDYLNGYYDQQFGVQQFQGVFNKIYYSHILGIRKPHPEGFLKIMEEQQLKPNEIFYLDDGSMHIAAAKKLGIHAVQWIQNAPLC